ncbi:MAG: thioredoxin family protein [Leadbetterella sp.]
MNLVKKLSLGGIFFFLTTSLSIGQSTIKFYQGTYDDLIRAAKKQNKTIFLDFYSNKCSPCNRLESTTFQHKEFVRFTNAQMLVYKINIDSPEGKEIIQRFNIDVVPAMVVLDPKQGILGTYKGFYSGISLVRNITKIHENNGLAVQETSSKTLVAQK